MHAVGAVVHLVLWIFIGFMWVRFIVDWVQVFARSWAPSGILLLLLEVVYSVTDPPIKAIRRAIPPVRIGPIALDLGFILTLLIAIVLLRINDAVLLG